MNRTCCTLQSMGSLTRVGSWMIKEPKGLKSSQNLLNCERSSGSKPMWIRKLTEFLSKQWISRVWRLLTCNLQRLERNCYRRRRCRTGTWISFKLVGSTDEENCLVIALRLGWELLRLGLAALGGGGEALLGDEKHLDGMGRLREREETAGDVVRLHIIPVSLLMSK